MEIDIEEEQKTESYKVTLNIDIENIEKLKISTIIIKHIGGKSMKLYNNSPLIKLVFPRGFFLTLQE